MDKQFLELVKLDDEFINEVLADWNKGIKEHSPDIDKLMAYVDDIGVRMDEMGVNKERADKIYNQLCDVVDSFRNEENTFPYI